MQTPHQGGTYQLPPFNQHIENMEPLQQAPGPPIQQQAGFGHPGLQSFSGPWLPGPGFDQTVQQPGLDPSTMHMLGQQSQHHHQMMAMMLSAAALSAMPPNAGPQHMVASAREPATFPGFNSQQWAQAAAIAQQHQQQQQNTPGLFPFLPHLPNPATQALIPAEQANTQAALAAMMMAQSLASNTPSPQMLPNPEIMQQVAALMALSSGSLPGLPNLFNPTMTALSLPPTVSKSDLQAQNAVTRTTNSSDVQQQPSSSQVTTTQNPPSQQRTSQQVVEAEIANAEIDQLAASHAQQKQQQQPSYSALDSGLVEQSAQLSQQSQSTSERSSGSGCSLQRQPSKQRADTPTNSRDGKLPNGQQSTKLKGTIPSRLQETSSKPPTVMTKTDKDNLTMRPPPARNMSAGSLQLPGPKVALMAILGGKRWQEVRSMLLRQQQTFVQQLFELHKLTSLQKFLCMEVMGDEDPNNLDGYGGSLPWDAAETSNVSLPSVTAPPPKKPTNSNAIAQKPAPKVDGYVNGTLPIRAAASEPGVLGADANQLRALPPLTTPANSAPHPLPNGFKDMPPPGVNVFRPQPVRPAMVSNGPTVSMSVMQPGSMDAGMAVDQQQASMASNGVPAVEVAQQQQQQAASHADNKVTSNGNKTGSAHILEAAHALLTSGALPLPGLLTGQKQPSHTMHGSTQSMPAASMSNGTANQAFNMLGSALPVPSSMGPPQAIHRPDVKPGAMPAPAAIDPHTLWFSKHIGSVPVQIPQPTQDGNTTSMVTAVAPSSDKKMNSDQAPNSAPAAPAAPVRWWQDEAATFGDHPPSGIMQTASNMTSGVKQGSNNVKRPASRHAGASQPNGKKARSAEHAPSNGLGSQMDMLYNSSAKAGRARKSRSKRGSNRVGARDGSMASDESGSSLNQEASCAMGSIAGGNSIARQMSEVRPWNGTSPSHAGRGPMNWDYADGVHRQSCNGARDDPAHLAPTASEAGTGSTQDKSNEDKSAAGILLSLSCGSGAICQRSAQNQPVDRTQRPHNQGYGESIQQHSYNGNHAMLHAGHCNDDHIDGHMNVPAGPSTPGLA